MSAVATRQKRDIEPLLFQCWVIVTDGGPPLEQQWFNVSCLLGRIWLYSSIIYNSMVRRRNSRQLGFVDQIVASELKDPIWHSSEWQIGSFSSEATKCNPYQTRGISPTPKWRLLLPIVSAGQLNITSTSFVLCILWWKTSRFSGDVDTSVIYLSFSVFTRKYSIRIYW